MPRHILGDAGFLIGLYDPDDPLAGDAQNVFQSAETHRPNWIFPWPVLYESVTHKVAAAHNIRRLHADWLRLEQQGRLSLEDDAQWRESALAAIRAIQETRKDIRSLSLADEVLRAMLLDRTIHIHALVTGNAADFRAVCNMRGIDLVELRPPGPRSVRLKSRKG